MPNIVLKDRLGTSIKSGHLAALAYELRNLVADMIPDVKLGHTEVEYRNESLESWRLGPESQSKVPALIGNTEVLQPLNRAMNLTPLVVHIEFSSRKDYIPGDPELFKDVAAAVIVHLSETEHLSDEVNKVGVWMDGTPDGVYKQMSR